MKKPTFSRLGIVMLFFLGSMQLYAQNYVPFTPRFDQDLRGDIVLIGNNILGPDNNAFNDDTVYNHTVDMRYIDIDNDASTFSSSSADLTVQNPNCYRIIHAGLYWGAVTRGNESITNVKLRGPSGGYNDVVGTIIYDANGSITGDSFPYSCYADVTDIVTGLTTQLGTYTMANVSSAQGRTGDFDPWNGTGYSAGWSLFIVYEDPTMPGKSITSFDGFSAISSTVNLDVPVSGFRTVPAPTPVRANFAFAALEGDKPILNDRMVLNGVPLSAADRDANNFFNSSVTQLSATPVNSRVPNSTNTLGFDTGVMVVPNPSNSVIANDATSAIVRLESDQDVYFQYFFALAVDIIEPKIFLTKIVEDEAGNDIGGQLVDLGDILTYVIGFENRGNDNATETMIRDILPINIIFNYPEDIVDLPPGVTVRSYDPVTREIIFDVDNSIVEENDPVQYIRFKVQVVETCGDLQDSCSNIITNQAFTSYKGTLNPNFLITDDPSFSTNTGCLLTPSATNFLADLDCTYIEEVVLCGDSTVLTAADGYESYSWSKNPGGNPVIGTGQSITVTETGTYYSFNTAVAPCQSIEQEYEVVLFSGNTDNPVIPFADQVVTCPNDGKLLPLIFLCGDNDTRLIDTGITDSSSMIWEILDESSCDAVDNEDCANEDDSCTWNQVETGPSYLVDTKGQYRLTINYEGGCFNQFYFNVYENLLVPTITKKDIECDSLGEIIVGGVPGGYEFSIDGSNYQTSNIFTISQAGIYTVYIRQIGIVSNPCIFEVPDIQILDSNFEGSAVVINPLCYGEKGSVILAAIDSEPQFYYSIYSGGNLVNSVGPIDASDYTFDNLNTGNYTINISTEDGCTYTEDITIVEPPLLTVTAALTKPLDCEDGEITIYPEGGTPPYFYFINSTTEFQNSPIVSVDSAGTYNITVVDNNNCTASTSITVEVSDGPIFTVDKTDILCSDTGNTGTITVNVSNGNGNTIKYSIDDGVTFFDSNVFSGLAEGDYNIVVQFSKGNSNNICTSSPQTVTITTDGDIVGTADLTAPYTCNTFGEITVTNVSGGTAPYTYSIDGINFQASSIFSGLSNGTYTVTVKDSSDCTSILETITINALNPPTDLEFDSTTIDCNNSTSTITITNSIGGEAPLEYQITAPAAYATSYQTSTSFSGLDSGSYTIQVRDANGCEYSESVTIAPSSPLTVDVVLTNDIDCTTGGDALISGNINGSSPPYNVTLIQGSGSVNVSGNTFTLQTSNSGNYQFQITDNLGCQVQSSVIVVTNPVSITVSNSTVDPSCNGSSDGSITLNPTSGQAPFTYSIDGGTNFVNTNVFGGLSAGSYDYVVMGADGCNVSGTLNLNDPPPIDVSYVSNPVQCNPDVPGSIDVTINSGGVAPFSYTLYDDGFNQIGSSVSTGATTNTFSGLSFGDYFVSVIDSTGCEYNSSAIRIETPPSLNLLSNTSSGTCVSGASVEIEVASGVGPFTYSIYGQPATSFGPTLNTTHTFNGLSHGAIYQFQVVDSGGCSSLLEVVTPTLSSINISQITATDINCFGVDDGTLNFTISDYSAGTTSLYYEIQDQLTNTPIVPAQNGTLNGLTGAPANGSVTGLPAGNYNLFVREVDGTLCTISSQFTINPQNQPLVSVTASIINANCNVDAQVTINTTGGTPPYEYAVGAPGFTPNNSDYGSSNVIYLDYTIRTNWDIVTRDANGCEERINETIAIDPEPTIEANISDECIDVDGNFMIDVSMLSTGVAPYTFSIDSGAFQTNSTPFTISNLASGTHTIQVMDANGCGNMVTIDISPPTDFSAVATTLPSCSNDDGEISMTIQGGSGSFDYTISPSAPSISLSGTVFTGVPPGSYTISMLDTVTSCTESLEIVVPGPENLNFTTTPNGVSCFGDNNGSFEIDIINYSGPYTYEVFDSNNVSVMGPLPADTSTNPFMVSGMSAGTYTVEVIETSAPFCSAIETVIIPSPFEGITLDATETSNVSCENNSGTIVAIASGGTGSFEYELTGAANVAFSPNGSFSGLSAGSYTINARDEAGCIASTNITLVTPPPINATATASATNLACFGDKNATISVNNVTGGQGSNYTYTLHMTSPIDFISGPQSSPDFNGLGPGTYEVIVTDGISCEFTSPLINISEPPIMIVSLVKDSSQTCTTNTTLTLSASGGTGSYSYSDDQSFSNILGTFTSSTTFSVGPGTYSYFVRDSNGCIANVSNEIQVDPLPDLEVVLDATNAVINCLGDETGMIIAEAQGGLGNYVYTLQNGAGNDIPGAIQNSPGVFTNLAVGTYQVYVEDGDCLETSEQITIQEPTTQLLVDFEVNDVTCTGEDNGRIDITATGGNGIIKYAISPQLDQFFDDPTFDDLAPGDYSVIVQDELGCYVYFDFTISSPEPVIINIVPSSMMPEVCEGEGNGEFSIEISGGNMPYSVSLDNYDGPYTTGNVTQTQFDFYDLEGGDHIVYVRDSQGCESEWNITFPEPVRLDPQLSLEFECTDNSLNNVVTVTIDPETDPSEVDYSLNGGPFQPDNVFYNVSPGTDQYVEARHTNGCLQSTITFDIPDYVPLELILVDGDINEIIAQVKGGSGEYEFFFNGESHGTNNSFIITETGDYTVMVVDANGCTVEASKYLEFIDICIPNYFTPNGDGVLDEWGIGCSEQYDDLTFDIYDRYGRVVAKYRQGEKWDGKYNGRELPTGDYWFVVRLNSINDGREFVGHFTLYR